MILPLLATALISASGGMGIGLLIGRRVWGPQWFDTSEGIDRRLRKARF